MDLTPDQFAELCKDVCPACARGNVARKRTDTGEWAHDFVNSTGMSHSFCLASHLRNKHESVFNG